MSVWGWGGVEAAKGDVFKAAKVNCLTTNLFYYGRPKRTRVGSGARKKCNEIYLNITTMN